MLYCPKCQATYTDGTQRFCTNEGARLQPYHSESGSRSRGVFTSILNKNLSEKSSTAKSSDEVKTGSTTELKTPSESRFFKAKSDSAETSPVPPKVEKELPLELEIDEPDEKSFQPIPIARVIDPRAIPERGSSKDRSSKRKRKISPSPLFSPNEEISLDVFESEPEAEFQLDPDDPLGATDLFDSETAQDLSKPQPDDLLSLESPQISDLRSNEPLEKLEKIELDPESSAEVDVIHSIPPIELELRSEEKAELVDENLVFPPVDHSVDETTPQIDERSDESESAAAAVVPAAETADTKKAVTEEAWEKRSSDAADLEESTWYLYPVIGVLILLLGAVALYFLLRSDSTVEIPANNGNLAAEQPAVNANAANSNFLPQVEPSIEPPPQSALLDIPPPPRIIKQPPNTVLYRNQKRGQSGKLAQKFLEFSIYYPKDWTIVDTGNKFLDIARRNPEGVPIKQILISQYDSNGTFEADKALFPELVKNSNLDLSKILANYNVLSEGEIVFQNGRWRAWEVKFEGIGGKQKLTTWGRRLWIPVQRRGMKSGFIITVIATSLANNIKSANDLDNDKEIEAILKTFEPDLN